MHYPNLTSDLTPAPNPLLYPKAIVYPALQLFSQIHSPVLLSEARSFFWSNLFKLRYPFLAGLMFQRRSVMGCFVILQCWDCIILWSKLGGLWTLRYLQQL